MSTEDPYQRPQEGQQSQSNAGGTPAYGGPPPAAPPPAPGGYEPYPQNSLGVWSLVLGIVSLVMCGLFTGIPAIIVGNKAKAAVRAGQANNEGLATGGVITGWIGTILSVLGLVIWVIALIALAAGS